MKRIYGLTCLLVICGFMFFFLPSVRAESAAAKKGDEYATEQARDGIFHLPPALLFIGEDAFEATAAEGVILPETVQTIQSRAFAEMPRLEAIIIPDSVLRMGDDIFAGDWNVTIYGSPGSKAEEYAQENRIDFQPVQALTPSESSDQASAQPLNTVVLFLTAAFFLFVNRMRATCMDRCETNRIRPKRSVALHALDLIFP